MNEHYVHNVNVAIIIAVIAVIISLPALIGIAGASAGSAGLPSNYNHNHNHNHNRNHSHNHNPGLKQVIIIMKDKQVAKQVMKVLKQDISTYGGKIKCEYKLKPAVAASLPPAVIQKLKKNPNLCIIDDLPVYTVGESLDWGVDRIDADIVHPENRGTGVNVAIMDTGIDYNHPDLAANYRGGYDFGGDYPGAANDDDPMDTHGHGTHCAGIVGAIMGNGIGVIGVAPEADLYAVKVFPDNSNTGNYSDIIEGLEWCINTHMDDDPDNDIQVISMSFGSYVNEGDPGIEPWIDAAYNAGILLVGAAGNAGSGTDTVIYPARYENVIAVGATDQNDNRAWFSSTGPAVELAAPGVSIKSTGLNGGYFVMSGTSVSCPMVSGTAALVWSAYPGYDNTQVRQRLQMTAEDLGTPGRDEWYGYGLVDAGKAGKPPETETPPVVESVRIIQDNDTESAEEGVNVSIEPEPGGNRTVTVSAVVKDADGWDDVNTVIAKIEGPDTVADSPVILHIISHNETTGIFNGRFNMSFYYHSGEYVVNVTAVDRTGLSGYNSTSLFYLPAIALELDADTIAFGSLDPGESREMLGDADMSTPEYPTVWNTGNVAIDIEVNGTGLSTLGSDVIAVRIGDEYKELGEPRRFYVNISPDGKSAVDFKLSVPCGTPCGNYSGRVSLKAVMHSYS